MATRETVRTMTAGQMKEVASALLEAIPTDLPFDQVQRRIGNKRELGKSLRTLLIGDQQSTDDIVELPVNYDEFRSIRKDRYYGLGDVKMNDVPEVESGTKPVRFRELEFDHDPLDQEVLEKAEAENCRQPSRAEAETYIRRFSAEQLGKNPRVGLIGPEVRRHVDLSRVGVLGNDYGVYLRWRWTEKRWRRHDRFVVVCK